MIRSSMLFGRAMFAAIALFVGMLITPYQAIAEPPGITASPQATPDRPDQLFELRIYTAAPGKLEALNQRFRDHTLRLFKKHGIKSIGYWTEADERDEQRLYYLVAYPDRAAREKMLMQGIAVDPEFRQVVAESEKDGKLTTKIESVLLSPTDYSALK